MSQENVDLVRRTFAAMLGGDYEAARNGFHEDAVWHNTGAFPGPQRCVGREAIVDFWKTLMESFDTSAGDQEIEQATGGNGVVVLGLHAVGRGVGSGAPIDVRWAAAVQVLNGLISRVDVYGNWERALRALGLEE
jgi:ketosteroid isomerase-like protein